MALRRLSVVAVVAMYLVLVMGALVTNTASGEGCGATWPLCHGRLVPLADVHALIEWSHRAVTSLATVAVLALAVLAWRHPGPRARNRWFAAIAVTFLFGEAAVGAAAVIWPQPTALLATHFGISLVAYSGVFLLALCAYAEGTPRAHAPRESRASAGVAPAGAAPALAPPPDPGPVVPARHAARRKRQMERALSRTAWFLLVYTFGVIYSGAYVRHDGSFCAGWPVCEGGLVPAWGSPEFPQFVHRVLAGVLLLALLFTWRRSLAFARERPDLPRAAGWALAFGVAQAFTGFVVVRTGMSVSAAMLHAAVIPLLFSAELYLALTLGVLGSGQGPSEDALALDRGGRVPAGARRVATP